ncbi:MAG: outer membrane beta-barrel protein [Mesorhizobium sp.]|jgi:opacity protein-like surface antigen
MDIIARGVLPALAAGLLLSTVARAADYEPPIFVEEAPEVSVEVGSGWYLRGDFAYSFDRTEADFSGLPGIDVSRTRFGGGGGVGYHFTDYLRGDVTLSFLSRDEFNFDDGFDSATLKTESWSGMATTYLDLGTYSGVTPYVGVGLGALYTRNTFDAFLPGIGTFDEADNQYEFAYSLAAGFAYQVAKNWSVDLGYLFTSSPETEFVELTSAGLSIDEGLDFHQVRVGLRYDLW